MAPIYLFKWFSDTICRKRVIEVRVIEVRADSEQTEKS
jgi:hypothetical protein